MECKLTFMVFLNNSLCVLNHTDKIQYKKNMFTKIFFQQYADQFCWKHLTVIESVLESNNISPASLYSVENVFNFFLKLNFKLLHHCKFH